LQTVRNRAILATHDQQPIAAIVKLHRPEHSDAETEWVENRPWGGAAKLSEYDRFKVGLRPTFSVSPMGVFPLG